MMAYEKSVFVPLDADETFALVTRPERLRRWQATPPAAPSPRSSRAGG
jgi:hypothetical protein